MDEHPEIDVEWTGFQLRPDAPLAGSRPFEGYPPSFLEDKKKQFDAFARSWGVEGHVHNDRMPNTLRVLAMAEYARDEDKLRPFREAAMDAHWYQGLFLGDERVLRGLAEKAGLDAEAAWVASGSVELQARVVENRDRANALGITGVPTFIFVEGEDALAVVGCQPYEVLVDAMAELKR